MPRVDKIIGISADCPGTCVATVLECQDNRFVVQSLDGSMSLMHEDGVGNYTCGLDVFMSDSSSTVVFLDKTHMSSFHDSKSVVLINHYVPYWRLPGS